jgi:ATP-dependent DNA helicase RecQ
MSSLQEQLKQRFGFDAFREGQEDAISRLLEGKSVLAIFPTGGGKSLCYQLPALLLDGLTVVISPLIALMKDQLDFLISKGAPAARLDSTLTKEENRQLFDDLYAGNLKLLYISPERLGNERFLRAIGRQRISLLAIDEAHCISEWGHNFRPNYLKIGQLAKDT